MIQDIAPHEFDNAYAKRRPARDEDRILCFNKGEVFLKDMPKAASGFDFPSYREVFGHRDSEADQLLTYLFAIDEIGYFLMEHGHFLARLEEAEPLKAVGAFRPTQSFRTMGEGDTVPLAMMTGLHVATWMRKNRYCGCCGSETKAHETERALTCPGCGNLIFPQISPSVAVAVVDGDRILLACGAQSAVRRFALIAGFVEIGESVEETVHREVLEEVGVKVKNLEYFKSQPWGLTGIQMLGFFAELEGSDQVTIQEDEIAEAKWFTADEIDRNMAQHSLSFTMIQEFCRRQDEKKCK